MATWFAQQPGSEESLLALYDAVGAAEELDLEQQAHGEDPGAEVDALPDGLSDDFGAPFAVAEPSDAEEIDEATHVSMAQAVGLIEHLLGGRPMGDGGHSDG